MPASELSNPAPPGTVHHRSRLPLFTATPAWICSTLFHSLYCTVPQHTCVLLYIISRVASACRPRFFIFE